LPSKEVKICENIFSESLFKSLLAAFIKCFLQALKVQSHFLAGSGRFEVTKGQSIICEGSIKTVNELLMTKINVPSSNDDDQIFLNEDNFYKIYHLMGNHYQGAFRNIKKMNAEQTKGTLLWMSNWITLIDAMLVNSISLKTKSQTVMVDIRKIVLNPKVHFELLSQKTEQNEILLDLLTCPYLKITQAGGVELHSCKNQSPSKRRSKPATLENYKFVPYFPEEKFSKEDSFKIFLQLIHENLGQKKMKVVEIHSYEDKEVFCSEIVNISGKQTGPDLEVSLLSSFKHPFIDGVQIVEGGISQFTAVDVIVTDSFDENFSSEIRFVLNKDGFVICREVKLLDSTDTDFNVISKLQVGEELLFLLQLKKRQNKKYPTVEITSNVDDWLGNLKLCLDIDKTIAFSNRKTCGIIGLANCIRKESYGEELRCFLIMDENAPKFSFDEQFYSSQIDLELAVNVLKDGKWGSYRHLQFVEENYGKSRKGHVFADCLFKGDLSTLSWIQGPLDVNKLALDQNFVTIYFAALNFKDVVLATGKIVNEIEDQVYSTIGFEFSGITKSGQRIMGFRKEGGLMSSHCLQNDVISWNVPNTWTLQQAATVPIVYATVYLAFFRQSKIEAGKTVLIHAGSGGVGQAAIQVALAYGLEVFTTVSTKEKKQFLLEKFPNLKKQNIGNSRDSSFEQMIQVNTKGKGVNFVLNCLTGDLLQASLRCVSKNGTFIEIGKYDLQNETKIHLGHFAKGVNFQIAMTDELDSDENKLKVSFKNLLI
jgi:fatty acid synthase, animal type